MARYSGLSRRDFLKVGVAGGGLLLALQLPARAVGQPVQQVSESHDLFEPNAWIRIGSDGSVLFEVARSEMGQGVMTALPMLIAEELCVGLDQISVRFAPAAPEYTNQLIGQQLTGGSTSIRDAWTKLREAGAVARTMLVEAAARRWDVDAGECRVERAEVLHPDGSQRLGFGELAEQAASMPVPPGVFLKEPDEWTLIGSPAPRLDTPRKVNGRARYGIDVRLTNMVLASVERCPVFGGTPRAFDANAALQAPGVIAVVGISGGVAVVAEDTWSALRARKLLDIDWDFGADAEVSSASIKARFERKLSGQGIPVRTTGNTAEALLAAEKIVEAVYETPFQAHACMEPMNCTADARADGCDIYVPTQAQTRCQRTGMEVTGLEQSQVRVHTTFLGGGFGRRGEQDFVRDAVELSKRLERPVQVVWTREDDIRHDFYRPAGLNRLRAGLDADGLPSAWYHHIVGHSILSRVAPGAVADGTDRTSAEGAANLPYAIANVQVDYTLDNTHVPVGFWRAVGSSQNAWITECFIDELAAAGGHEPLALRRQLLAEQSRHLAVLNLVAAKA
ncbi:MAG: molybdopterin cofactor-binding domain-containing protein, partial [Thiohalocapsa sp.]